jgi:hypothetical protein
MTSPRVIVIGLDSAGHCIAALCGEQKHSLRIEEPTTQERSSRMHSSNE